MKEQWQNNDRSMTDLGQDGKCYYDDFYIISCISAHFYLKTEQQHQFFDLKSHRMCHYLPGEVVKRLSNRKECKW